MAIRPSPAASPPPYNFRPPNYYTVLLSSKTVWDGRSLPAMDSLVCEALSEICARGAAGVPIGDLWPRLQAPLSSSGLHLCGGVKQALWAGILRVPAVRAVVGGEQVGSGDASVQDVEEAERLGVRLVAASHLVDSSLGLYDIKYSGSEISAQQRRTLERLADSRYVVLCFIFD